MFNSRLHNVYECEKKNESFYTNGNIEWTADGRYLFCQNEACVKLMNIESGEVFEVSFIFEEDHVNNFTRFENFVITSHKSRVFKLWSFDFDNETGTVSRKSIKEVKQWKYIHQGPISSLKISNELNMLISGGSDSVVRLWDLNQYTCIGHLYVKDGVIDVIELYYQQKQQKHLLFVSGSDSGSIYCYNIQKKKLIHNYCVHNSKVTAINFDDSRQFVISAGRDKVIIVYDLQTKSIVKQVPVFQSIEALVMLSNSQTILELDLNAANSINCVIAGEDGRLHVWDVLKSKLLLSQSFCDNFNRPIQKLLYNKHLQQLLTVDFEQNLIISNTKSLQVLKEFCGFLDEILDVTFIGKENQIVAVATNSADFRVYDLISLITCSIVRGHKDIVLCLKTSVSNPNMLVSGSKDNTIRVWHVENLAMITCKAVVEKHMGDIISIAINCKSFDFIVSISLDNSIKFWKINQQSNVLSLECTKTQIGHDKRMTCVAVSHDDHMIATASRDKTVKLWSTGFELLSTLYGHKRGITCVRFSYTGPVLATSSSDCTVKIWSLTEFVCLNTIQVFDSSVLRVEFFKNGLQLLATNDDGFCLVCSVKDSAVVCNLKENSGRVNGLAINSDDSIIVTGCSQSILVKWVDKTVEQREKRQLEFQKQISEEQELKNCLENNQLIEAFKLTLLLDKATRAMEILRIAVNKEQLWSDFKVLLIRNLSDIEKNRLIDFITVWIKSTKTSQVAQILLGVIIPYIQLNYWTIPNRDLERSLNALMPFLKRHIERVAKIETDLQILNYIVECHES